MTNIRELRPLTAGRLLAIRRSVHETCEEELERDARCNAQVLAEACYTDGEPCFQDAEAVLETLTFPEMERILSRLTGEGVLRVPAAMNAAFDERRFDLLRAGRLQRESLEKR